MAGIELIGNAGFRVAAGGVTVFIDAFFDASPAFPARLSLRPQDVHQADLILVTHAHWDHFGPAEVAEAAGRTGATVVGPRSVVWALRGRVPDQCLVELEPARARGRAPAATARMALPKATVTAYRTFHGSEHNSYLVEMPGLRFFHDGDNEDTRRIDGPSLGRLDALLIGPWQGSGWVEFIEQMAPARPFLLHLTEEELREHEAGRFLPDICDRVPEGLIVLRPGQVYRLGQP